MNRYFIKFSYLGTHYRGMQKNSIKYENIDVHDPDTIQGALECAFLSLTPKCITSPKITCSSRTDAGVHSFSSVAHIDLQNTYNSFYNPIKVLKCVNRYLTVCKHDIRLLEFIPVKNCFNARKLAKSRTYLYRFMRAKDDNNNNHQIPIVELKHAFHFRSDSFDPEKVKQATKLFMGLKDFRTFSASSHTGRKIQYVRQLNSLCLEKGTPFTPYDPLSQYFDFWNITCSAQSFLYNQVRRIVGSLLDLGCGLLTEKDIITMLQVPAHKNYIPNHVVPPFGLYLKDTEYCQEELDKYIIKYKVSPNNDTIIPLDENEITICTLTMDLNSLVKSKKLQLKSCKTVVTSVLGQKYEEFNGIKKKLPLTGTPFVIDDKPDLQIAHVIKGLFLSSQDPVVSKEILQKYEIRHVLSIGIDILIKFDDIKYYYCDLLDLPESNLLVAIKKCFKIIDEHRDENILIHCNAGVSRSSAIVISYIMALEKIPYEDAFNKVKNVRSCIKPNEGFVQQLRTLQLSTIL